MNIRVSGKTSNDYQCQDQMNIGKEFLKDDTRCMDSAVEMKLEGNYYQFEHFKCWLNKSRSYLILACRTYKSVSPNERVR